MAARFMIRRCSPVAGVCCYFAKKVRAQASSRSNVAEIARNEWVCQSCSFATLRANLGYAFKTVHTNNGVFGVTLVQKYLDVCVWCHVHEHNL